ncbi:hypothetical protein HYALB_00000134 [Hymenoscyphus albidus]|uniref:Uncharacterized protein n=1 Tax=Hymenoscyphus albidus TaxID=595503 RepID=A0A9N9LKW9_9HELO|nr:hypothetical protein HYALB_00000134 [Hymenoscyphus albidus]
MSGSGGYYKYRCKYFYTHNCPHWVWVNNAPCAHCLADGRDFDTSMIPNPFRLSHEVYVPQIENGALQYIIFKIVATSDMDSGWTIKDHPQTSQLFPTATGPSAVNLTAAVDNRQKQRTKPLGDQGSGVGWNNTRSTAFE